MSPVKKQMEILLMHYFKSCHSAFPKGKLVPAESPDFILKLKSKNQIGIELTRLYPESAGVLSELQLEQHEIQDKMIDSSRLLFENTSPLKLFVKFLFAQNSALNHMNSMVSIVQIVNVMRKSLQGIKAGGNFSVLIEGNMLPDGLECILILGHPVLEVSVWERSNNLGLSDDVLTDVNTAILKKDEKLRLYHKRNLNLYWLIITTDRLRGIKSYNLMIMF